MSPKNPANGAPTCEARVLVVEDDEAMRVMLDEELREAGYDVVTAAGGEEALELISTWSVDVVVTDQMMPGMKGRELLSEIQSRNPRLPVVITTAFGTIESAVDAIKAGAFHYVAKPFRVEQLLAAVSSALRERRQLEELVDYRETFGETPRIVAESSAMKAAIDMILRAAPAATPVLLLGESGTGKELLARALHAGSPRGRGAFIPVNCSAIPEQLLESQLFGYRRGAYTDAREDRRGLFQEADGGTILLDEIGDMPPPLQGKLLRVLQEREVHPLGAPAPVLVDVRIVAATHRDLESLVREERFRHDLYYRLNVISVRIPPLRERPEDIVPLIAHFLEKHGHRLGRPGCTLSPEALTLLRGYSWPGNVRELESAIERALVLGRESVLGLPDLPETLRGAKAATEGTPQPPRDVRSLGEIEREHILRVLRAARGNKTAAARLLGLDRKTLYRKLQHYGIQIS